MKGEEGKDRRSEDVVLARQRVTESSIENTREPTTRSQCSIRQRFLLPFRDQSVSRKHKKRSDLRQTSLDSLLVGDFILFTLE